MVVLSGKAEDVARFLRGVEAGERFRFTIRFLRDSSRESESGVSDSDGKNEHLLLDAGAVAKMLGLTDRKNPREAVRYLHRTGRLVAIKEQRRLRWRREDVEDYVRRLSS